MPAKWYVARVRSNAERHCRQFLAGRAIRCFLPIYHAVSKRPGPARFIERPLFPGYLFVFITIPGPEKRQVQQAPGFVDLVQFGGSPAAVDADIIDTLYIMMGSPDAVRPHPLVRPGKRVTVVDGPFKGAQGRLSFRSDRKMRLVVDISLLGRAVSIPVEANQLEPHMT